MIRKLWIVVNKSLKETGNNCDDLWHLLRRMKTQAKTDSIFTHYYLNMSKFSCIGRQLLEDVLEKLHVDMSSAG